MNVRRTIEAPRQVPVLSVAFNNDNSFFSVGLNTGFRIYDSDTGKLKNERDFNAGIGLAQMMGRSNILGLVGGGRLPKFAQNKLILWDDSKGKTGPDISTLTAIRGVRLARDRIVIVLQNSVLVYTLGKNPEFITSFETADNLLGLCALSDKLIVVPGRTLGQVQMVQIATGAVSIIPAHSSALKALAMSPDGEMLATASDAGTLIRVWNTSNTAKLAELRRGIDAAIIYSLGFSPSGLLLACTSDKNTIHIFDVPHPSKPPREPTNAPGEPPDDGKNAWGILSKLPFMPRQFYDTYSFTKAPIDPGEEPTGGLLMSEGATLGTTKPQKGVLGWLDENTVLVIGAGLDARWEKFVLVVGDDGRRYIRRFGWQRYMTEQQ